MSKIGVRAGISLLTVAALHAPAQAAQWQMDPAASSLTVEAKQTGAAFTGRFEEFSTQIDFDPADPAAGSISVTINPGSFASGASDRDGMAGQAEWFAVDTYPEAQFVSSEITQAGEGSYVAAGTLTIKGIEVPVELPFKLAIDGTRAVADGELPLDRLAFGVGTGDWEDDSVISTNVTVRFHVEADSV